MRIIFLLLLLFSGISSYAQNLRGSLRFHIPRDKVKLKNEDSETGKIIYSDSNKIILQKYDYSEKNILRKDIDTITGLSYFTYFIAPSIGYVHWDGLINQRLDTFSTDAANFILKFGTMRKKHNAANLYIGYQAGNNHKLFHFGAGIRRYFFSDYTKKKNIYLGINLGHNIPYTNMNKFFDISWCFGYEYLLLDKYRLFFEFNWATAQIYTPKPTSFSISIGTRIGTEYKTFYTKLNGY